MPGTSEVCPRCGSPMVVRRNRSSGQQFLGCSLYPACYGTRELDAADPSTGSNVAPARASRDRQRYRLSLGGRPKGFADNVELLVAKRIGRNLTKREGCLVQGVTILLAFLAIYWFFTSPLYVELIKAISEWYAHQIRLPGAPGPTG